MIRKGYRDLINTAIHNYYHDDIPLEMELKDYFYEVQSKSEAFDATIERQESRIERLEERVDLTDNFVYQDKCYKGIEKAEDIIEALRSQLQ